MPIKVMEPDVLKDTTATEVPGKPTTEELREAEPNILRGLLSAAGDIAETWHWIAVKRPDENGQAKEFFRFRIHSLDERQLKRITEVHSIKTKNRQGILTVTGLRESEFKGNLIYEATHPEDRKNIWDNPEVHQALGVRDWSGVIDKVLKAGEKDSLVEIIAEISGYSTNNDSVELIKN